MDIVMSGVGVGVPLPPGINNSGSSSSLGVNSSINSDKTAAGSVNVVASGGSDDLNTLEAEISELQRENARVESQMMRLKSDINAMESQLSTSDRVRRLRFVDGNKF